MELLRVVKRRSLLSEIIYILLNLALAAAILIVIISTGSPWLALALVVLSKWRVFAVRPRYWFAHIEANMVDMIVSVSVVFLIHLAGQTTSGHALVVQILFAVLYAAWLLLLKPRTKRIYIAAQAGVAIFVGSMTLASLSYEWPSSLVVLVFWLVGYSCARHVLMSHSDSDIRLMSLIWGLVFAEIGWLTYHWTIAYNLPLLGGLKLPQVTLVLLGVSFLAERFYASFTKHGKFKLADITMPLVFVIGVIFILMTVFNSASIGTA